MAGNVVLVDNHADPPQIVEIADAKPKFKDGKVFTPTISKSLIEWINQTKSKAPMFFRDTEKLVQRLHDNLYDKRNKNKLVQKKFASWEDFEWEFKRAIELKSYDPQFAKLIVVNNMIGDTEDMELGIYTTSPQFVQQIVRTNCAGLKVIRPSRQDPECPIPCMMLHMTSDLKVSQYKSSKNISI